jgi:crotonobetainyl-CoA:carnitine CoA-transferase CaiB-like acyl-CoA transferase
MSKPVSVLDGVRVLDFTRVLSGPYCTAMLSDLGAEVIKIEGPGGGDSSRSFLPPAIVGESTYFLQLNRNKLSVVLDLATDAGRRAAVELAETADVIVENFRPGAMQRFGLAYENVKERNPEVVYCSITGYGSTTALAERAGLDPVIQAESGLMAMTGEPDGAPMRIGISLVDVTSGMYASQAVLAALMHRQQTGCGQRVEVSLFETGVNMLANFGASYLMTGAEPERPGNGNLVAQPSGVYQAADGYMVLTCVGDPAFKRLCSEGFARPELAEDERFATNPLRLANVDALTVALNAMLAKRARGEWIQAFRAIGVPAGEVRTVPDAMRSPEFHHCAVVDEVDHPTAGTLPVLRSPIRMSATPVVAPSAAPLLGEHTAQVLAELELTDSECEEIARRAGEGM